MRIRPYGNDAVLVELPDGETARRLVEVLRAQRIGFEHRLGWCCAFVRGRDADALAVAVRDAATELEHSPMDAPPSATPLHVLHVRYDGEDLHDVADRCSMSVEAVVALHTAPQYTVMCLGFTRGFPYLEGLDARLHLDRRATPRLRVPAGAVAIAGAQTGVYPMTTPGGWHLLGTTDATIFDTDRTPPNLLAPGDGVRFVATR